MKFFYWSDKDSPRLFPIKHSAKACNIDLSPIGSGQIEQDWGSTLFKQQALYEAVSYLNEHEIVFATDGYDVFYQQEPDYIQQQFLAIDHDVVFSAEKGFSHQYPKFKSFFESQATASPYKYLNAGTVVGYAGALETLYKPSKALRSKLRLARMLKLELFGGMARRTIIRIQSALRIRRNKDPFLLPWYGYTDQAIMAKYYATSKYNLSITLDRDCNLFGCTAYEWEDIGEHYQLVNGKLKNQHTGSFSACIHVPWTTKYEEVFLELFKSVHGTKK